MTHTNHGFRQGICVLVPARNEWDGGADPLSLQKIMLPPGVTALPSFYFHADAVDDSRIRQTAVGV